VYQTETIIALGSNLGNAIFNLRCAVRELENIGNIKKIANIYISSPYGYKSQSNFFNTAIKLLTNQQPLELINNILFSISVFLILIEGKFEPSEVPEKASFAACSELLAAFKP